ncbi:MAG: flagellar hook-associated protein FlgK [Thiomonas arsenitoxydans]|uniref:Flagellar hook-associated protein 1 n=1 Tax=Thiomonas arsenitoxydans (strain DSM 22701 / CIP 110005 / 3As) TaxID=426114 RepID=A0A8I1MY86_THIA3|nr:MULTISPECIES: flagellar hook-associated protein FlgK [Thiomonas]MBN8745225.1 flagellar hook-associated protein FlgK [Thiomonas arsenitoxydans]ODU96335.1 MAG: flagellar hook-associated protein FlgK [Thiomonas sp. SCN 64-16]
MSGISGLLNNALTGLQAAQSALQVTGNNIANVNTPGYSRETAVQSTLTPSLYGGQYLGNGTQIDAVTRSYNSYLQSQVWSTAATASGANTLNTQIQPIANLIAGTDSGLSTSINQFFASGVAQVAANPADLPSRQSLISQSQSLAQTIQTSAQQLQSAASGVNQQLGQSVTAINSLTQQIAQLNVQINTLSGAGSTPNSLLDQRDQLITQLSGQVGVTVLPQDGNQVNVFTGNGQVLVAGAQSFDLKTTPSAYDPSQLEVAYASNGAVLSQGLQGGTLGGLLQFRSQVLQPAQNALGRIADGLASAMNSQQAQGIDLNGQFGAALFQAGPVQVLASSANTGNAVISGSVVDANALTTADYRLNYDGSNWSVTNLSTGQPVSGATVGTSGSATVLNFDGVQVNVSGAQAGNSFEVQPTRYGALNFQSVLTNPTQIAAASPYVSSAGQMQSGSLVNTNLGNLTLSAGQYSATSGAGALVISGASVPTTLQVTLTSGGTSGAVGFQVTQSGSATVLASGSLSLGGSGQVLSIPYANNPPGGYWNVTLAGSTAVSGDAFTLSPASGGNGGNAQAMAALQTAKTLEGGSTSLEGAYSQLVSQVATQGNQAQSALSAASAVAAQASAAQQSVSGVNLDEEATNLIQYQQAYQAAAKAIQVGNSLFTSLLQAVQ